MRSAPALRHVAVVVPARDEVDRIVATLRSIDIAARRLAPDVSHAVVVVADSCTDDTAGSVRRTMPDVVVLEAELHSAGAARRLGTSVALKRSPCSAAETWIASTDADTLVPPTWLSDQLRLAAQGVGAVAGVVDLRRDERFEAVDGPRGRRLLLRRFGDTYGRTRVGAHPHIHGANLGFRGDLYLAVGGWHPQVTGEDVDLWSRFQDGGHGLAAADLRVRTSARLHGRAPAGFAADLVRLVADLDPAPA